MKTSIVKTSIVKTPAAAAANSGARAVFAAAMGLSLAFGGLSQALADPAAVQPSVAQPVAAQPVAQPVVKTETKAGSKVEMKSADRHAERAVGKSGRRFAARGRHAGHLFAQARVTHKSAKSQSRQG